MKPLIDQNNVEKAQILHQLFPEEIKRFVSFMEACAEEILSSPGQVKDNWAEKSIITADAWVMLAKDIQKRIPKNGEALIKEANRFADQLFDGYTALFTIECLQKYRYICPNNRFNLCITMMYKI